MALAAAVLVVDFLVGVVRPVPGKSMKNIDTFFDDSDRRRIREAVTEAETHTSAEIVPVLTESSGRYDRAEDLAGCVLSIGLLSLCWLKFQDVLIDGSWQTQRVPSLQLGLPEILLILVLGFVSGSFLASRVWWIRRLFCSRREMAACLRERAIQAFQIHRVGRTQGATGVIIFISSFERMVFVMGDADISKHFKNEDFVEVKNAIIDGFRINQFGDGLVEGIRLCGQKLRQHYPLQPGDENELSNDLILWKQNL